MRDARVAFVVSSGRSGTALLGQKIFPALGVDARHEYQCILVQQLGALYYAGQVSTHSARIVLYGSHYSAAYYSDNSLFLDASNKLSWLIIPLFDLFPTTKFIHLIRDGRSVCSSYYHKLANEHYTDRAVKILDRYLNDTMDEVVTPPGEKEYWWPLPRHGFSRRTFINQWNRWQRVCWHWSEVNKEIERSLSFVPDDQKMTVKLEDLTTDNGAQMAGICDWLCIKWKPELLPVLQRPHNVIELGHTPLTLEQEVSFEAIAGEMQRKYYG